jgi:LEA14-like dessication related protein
VDIHIIDVNGKEVLPVSSEIMNPNSFQFDMNNLSAGVYLIKILIDEELVTKRVVLFD